MQVSIHAFGGGEVEWARHDTTRHDTFYEHHEHYERLMCVFFGHDIMHLPVIHCWETEKG